MRSSIAATAVVLVTGSLAAQTPRPDLSGTWVHLAGQAPASLPAAPSGVLGARFSLAITGSQVVITRPAGEVSIVATLPLDGPAGRTPVPGRLCEGDRSFDETARWEGDGLAITIVLTSPAGGGTPVPVNAKRILRLEAPDRLVVEGTMNQQGQARQVGAVYARSTDAMPGPRAAPPVATASATIAQVAWIGTTWRGTTGALTTEENWTPPASGGMMATARTLRGAALASFEFLCIAERGGSLAYIAMPDGRTTPTTFWLTAISDSSATFENPTHDYPQLVRYRRTADGGLETTISATGGARARSVTLQAAAKP